MFGTEAYACAPVPLVRYAEQEGIQQWRGGGEVFFLLFLTVPLEISPAGKATICRLRSKRHYGTPWTNFQSSITPQRRG